MEDSLAKPSHTVQRVWLREQGSLPTLDRAEVWAQGMSAVISVGVDNKYTSNTHLYMHFLISNQGVYQGSWI